MTNGHTKAQQLLEQARIALQYNDRQAARRLAQQAAQADPGNRDAWLFMAGLSQGNAQKAYLEKAERLSSSSSQPPFITDITGGEDALVNHNNHGSRPDDTGIDKRRIKKEPTQPIPVQKVKRPNYFAILATTILVSTVLFSLLVWISFPTPTVSAIDHSSQRHGWRACQTIPHSYRNARTDLHSDSHIHTGTNAHPNARAGRNYNDTARDHISA